MRELKIDKDLRDLLPPLTKEEFEQLEKNIIKDGCQSPIITWDDYIVDGHNRYKICTKHNINFDEIVLGYETKDDIIQWMVDTQLGRRNLTPIQRIAIAEKYRPIIEKKAKENQGNRNDINFCQNSDKSDIKSIDTKKELSNIAKVSYDTYYKGKRILENGNEEIKKKLENNEISINKAYNTLFPKKKNPEEKSKKEIEINIEEVQSKPIDLDRPIRTNDLLKDAYGHPLPINEDTRISDERFNEELKDIKTPKNIVDYVNSSIVLEILEQLSEDFLFNLDLKLFTTEKGFLKMNEQDIVEAIQILDNHINKINDVKNKLKNEKVEF